MKHNQLFAQTRWRLITGYTSILSLILAVCAGGLYEAVDHAHRITINQELKAVSDTIYNSLKPVLKWPGKFDQDVINILPDLCLVNTDCFQNYQDKSGTSAIKSEKYYLYFFDLSDNLVAISGVKIYPLPRSRELWQDIQDPRGMRYRQITLELHTHQDQIWGYLQIGRNLEDFDHYVQNIIWIILLGLPLIILFLMICSWWLAGRAMQPLYQSYYQIQQFTADAAHELRTPLATLRATVESTLMLPNLTETESRETLTMIQRQNQRLCHLVADLLMLSRLDQKLNFSDKLAKDIINLNDLLDDITEEFYALAKDAEVTLVNQQQPGQFLQVLGNEDELYRLVANLVINAIEYTNPGGTVTLVLKQKNDQALIQVVDTGIGISDPDKKLIFNRFYRVDKARSRRQGGSGLGLSIAQAIAMSHQGHIEVKSQINQGSTFTVYLPLSSKGTGKTE